MRIRTIKPEFWTSEDVAALDWEARLIFIGLWSYVDDNGVGRDVEKLIVADLFPLEDDPRATLARVSRGLRTLSEHGLITRYEADGKHYLYVTAWQHQKIDHPSKGGCYPLPTSTDTTPPPQPDPAARESRETLAPVPGYRGTGVTTHSPTPDTTPPTSPAELVLVTADAATARSSQAPFDQFWDRYPRKVGKDAARRAWEKATRHRRIPPAVIVAGAQRYAADPNLPEKQYVPHPATWLARGGWDDEPCPPRDGPTTPTTAPAAGSSAWGFMHQGGAQ